MGKGTPIHIIVNHCLMAMKKEKMLKALRDKSYIRYRETMITSLHFSMGTFQVRKYWMPLKF